MTIRPKTNEEIAHMREGGQILNEVLQTAYNQSVPGIRLNALDALIAEAITKRDAKPSFLGYHGFPAASCLSVNDAVVHGIPNDYVLQEGDLLGIDIGVYFEGCHTDAAVTKIIGRTSPEKQQLVAVTQAALVEGCNAAIAGNNVGDIGRAVESYVKSQGRYGIIRDLSGHGIGANLQEPPEVLNYAAPSPFQLQNNMALAIEPMISLGDWRVEIGPDNWTVSTQDKSASAHFETTVLIHENDPQILVPFPLTC